MKFAIICKVKDLRGLLSALAELEWEFNNLAACLDGEVVNLLHNGDEQEERDRKRQDARGYL